MFLLLLQGTILLPVLLFTISTAVVMAYPPGAPIQACENGTNIIPRHISITNMASGAVPFTVDISNIGNRYTPGSNYTSEYQSCV